MERWTGKVAIVTGASTGIGKKVAESLLLHGMIVVGIARRIHKMNDLVTIGNGKFHAMECDVGDEKKVIEVFATIKKSLGSVHVLVNNAGILRVGDLNNMDSSKIREIFDINVYGLIYCSREASKIMKETKHEGCIVNIGSMLGHRVYYIPEHHMNIYPASKFAVRGFSESFQNELLGTGIRVTHISPGLVKTDIFESAGLERSLAELAQGLEPEDIADAVIYVIGTKPHVNIPELTLRHLETQHR